VADFLLIPLSDPVRKALEEAGSHGGEREALLNKLRARINNDVLTVSHGDLEKILVEWLAFAE
jgi:hypothetical protein